MQWVFYAVQWALLLSLPVARIRYETAIREQCEPMPSDEYLTSTAWRR